MTKVLNLSPRKLSGVLREADDDNGLVFIGFELFPLANVGYSKFPPVWPIDKFVYNGEVEAGFIEFVIFQGFEDACCCGCCWL